MDAAGKSDPYCKFEWRGEACSTDVVKNTLEPEWNETFPLRYNILSDDVPAALRVGVYDKDEGAEKDDDLGFVEIDLEEIGVPFEGWLKVKGEGASGEVRVRVERQLASGLNRGHTLEKGVEGVKPVAKAKAKAKPKAGPKAVAAKEAAAKEAVPESVDEQWHLSIKKGRGLKAMDASTAKSDPFCRLTWRNVTHETTVQPATLEPDWNETMILKYNVGGGREWVGGSVALALRRCVTWRVLPFTLCTRRCVGIWAVCVADGDGRCMCRRFATPTLSASKCTKRTKGRRTTSTLGTWSWTWRR
eukprot:GHVU01216191.1.p1 GENE.GHVU01216191.1~~GHVU01216191.1.p1  ORF type:complete len:328 (-),score=62.97 GHVU01216191.1:361-1269(-)